MTITQIRDHIRLLECQQDISPSIRAEWVQDALAFVHNAKGRTLLQQAARRLKRSGKKAKYPVLYSVQPLVSIAFDTLSTITLLDRAILQLRLTTLMRSVDAANVVWAIFTQENQHYLKCTTKSGQLTTFSIQGKALESILTYVHEHRQHPALFLFRSTVKPHQCLGSERIAKRLLPLMEMAGVDTDIFKSHSLRGATATHLLKTGVPHHLVQSRGAWTSSATLDTYYNRLHQSANWERLLEGEDAAVRHSAERAVLPSSASQSEPDEGRGSGEDKRASTARAAELDALGIRRPLYDQRTCMSCSLTMNNEAAYRCQRCKNMHHVRCMGHHACVGDRHLRYLTVCYLCALATSLSSHPRSSATDACIIDDPMGVCS